MAYLCQLSYLDLFLIMLFYVIQNCQNTVQASVIYDLSLRHAVCRIHSGYFEEQCEQASLHALQIKLLFVPHLIQNDTYKRIDFRCFFPAGQKHAAVKPFKHRVGIHRFICIYIL